MSIATMTRLASPSSPSVQGIAAANAPSEVQQTALEKITAFIPSEVIGIYIAGLGILSRPANSPQDGHGHLGWSLFAFCLVAVPLLVAINVQLRNRELPDEQR